MSEQPRLLFCCFDVLPAPTGLSRRITEYLKGLSDRFQVVVLSTKTPDHSHIERYQGARLLRVPVGSGDLQSRIQAFDRAVRRQLESEEYVIAHFFDPFGGYALADSRSLYGFRLVYDAQTFPSQELKYTHPNLEADRRFLSKVKRQELYCLMNADVVICGSDITRDYVLSLGAPPMSLHVFRQPVDLAPYTPQAMGRPDGSPMKLIHLGSQLSYQGLPTLLRAMQLALRQADLRLNIVGPKHPEWQPMLEELVSELKLTGKVEFQPPVSHDDLHKVLATADVGVLALDETDRSRQQGGPLAKIAEYMAAGRPVIASDLPVVRELVPESARVLFPAGDFKALADALVRLATHVDERITLGEAARAAAQTFDASAARGRLLDLYGALSSRGKSTAADATTQGEVTQLRASGSDTSKIRHRAQINAGRAPGETLDLDEEPPVVVGQMEAKAPNADDHARTAITEPTAPGNKEQPVVMGSPLPGRDEHTPVRPGPDVTEPTPITSARSSRRVISKSQKAVEQSVSTGWPEPLTTGEPKTEVGAETPAIAGPPRIKRTTEGKGVRSPMLPPAAPPAASPPMRPRIKLTTEGKGIRSPMLPVPGSMPSHAGALPPPPAASPPKSAAVSAPAASPPRPTIEVAVASLPPTPASPPSLPRATIPVPAASPPSSPRATIPAGAPSPRSTIPVPPASPPSSPRATVPAAPASPPPAPRVSPPMPLAIRPDVPPAPLPPPPAQIATHVLPDAPPPRVKRTTEGKGVRSPFAANDEPIEISADEVEAIEDDAPEPVAPVAKVPVKPAAGAPIAQATAPKLDVWLAQLVLGYCPPEALPFERPPPPTAMPGKDPTQR